jgi:hypothetical protein
MGDLIKVAPGQADPRPRESGPSQNIHLTLGRGLNGHIVAATVKVYGLSNKQRMAPLAGGATPDISRELQVAFGGEESDGSAADLKLHGFTAVNSIEVVSITYSDGSTWRADDAVCRVTPDPMMLIGAR